jgi:nucleoside-diphosphate-sugar epimerase
MIGGKIKHIPARLEPKDAEADNSKALKILGWKPKIELKKGISDLVINN